MPTKKLTPEEFDAWAQAPLPERCRHPDHDPAEHVVLAPGVYQHDCPGCARSMLFRVSANHRHG